MRFISDGNSLAEIPLVKQAADAAADHIVNHLEERLIELGTVWFHFLVDCSYAITLVGGAILLIVGVVSGLKKPNKYFLVLYVVYALLRFLSGGMF